METEVKADELARVYIKIRDFRKTLSDKFDADDAVLAEQQDTLAASLLEILKTSGSDLIRTQYGTISKKLSRRYWTDNWPEMYEIINEFNMPELLERRISTSNMTQFLEEHPENYPKGMNVEQKYGVSVRKPSKKI